MSRVLLSWWRLSRERGKVLRRREIAFRAWSLWAPRNRRLKASKRVLQAWTRQSTRANYFRQWATAMHVRSHSFLPPSSLDPLLSMSLSVSLSLSLSLSVSLSLSLQGIIASRTYSLRVLHQNLFQPKVLYLCYTLLDRVGHLMLLDCWQRWKTYWKRRYHWKVTKFRYRMRWQHERALLIFQTWKDFVQESLKQKVVNSFTGEGGEGDGGGGGEKKKHGGVLSSSETIPHSTLTSSSSSSSSSSSPPPLPRTLSFKTKTNIAIPPQISRRHGMIRPSTSHDMSTSTSSVTATATTSSSTSSSPASKDHFVLERVGWYTSSHLCDFIQLIEEGRHGDLDSTPSSTEFLICCHALWSRHSQAPPLSLPMSTTLGAAAAGLGAAAAGGEGKGGGGGGGEGTGTGVVNTPTATGRDGIDQGILELTRGRVNEEEISPEIHLQNAIYGMDTHKSIQAILDGVLISPELIENTSVHIGDKYIPLVAVLLSRCVPYLAKRILLNDCKEMVMRCNNPLTALLIGHHISRSIFSLSVSHLSLSLSPLTLLSLTHLSDGNDFESLEENGTHSLMIRVRLHSTLIPYL
jgi:hypothetical protein